MHGRCGCSTLAMLPLRWLSSRWPFFFGGHVALAILRNVWCGTLRHSNSTHEHKAVPLWVVLGCAWCILVRKTVPMSTNLGRIVFIKKYK